MRFDANHEISLTVSAGKLTKYHGEELIPTGKVLDVPIPQVFMRQTIKYTLWEKICKLRVDIFALIHGFELIREPKPQISIQMYTQPKSSTSQINQGFQRTLFNFYRTLMISNNY